MQRRIVDAVGETIQSDRIAVGGVVGSHIDGVGLNGDWIRESNGLPTGSSFTCVGGLSQEGTGTAPKASHVSPCTERHFIEAQTSDGPTDIRLKFNADFNRTGVMPTVS
jgi:hypothetical protein